MSRLTRDGTTVNLSRETKFSGANGDREIFIFSVQLTTSRIGNLTRLILNLAICVTIHTTILLYVCVYILPTGTLCHDFFYACMRIFRSVEIRTIARGLFVLYTGSRHHHHRRGDNEARDRALLIISFLLPAGIDTIIKSFGVRVPGSR